ncbi:hypothetical protein D0863_15305 [Hortaea werneckii]|uniref:Uncharacterized protein n=1 Tax=Hortaea werneckii TaxID=91943 RepID=A0A3M7CAA6_HORWE|nr:hypothetical protein D0863_15305 [Hortaea werneckii]
MSAPPANKKSTSTPGAPGNVRRQSAQTTPTASSAAKDNATPNRSPSRATPQASGAGSNTAAAGVNRTRSVRNGAPVSARAAARGKPQQAAPAENDTAMEDMKADMQAKLDELQEKLQSAEQTYSDSQKQATLLQHKLDEAHKTQSVLEEQVHEHTERVEELENEKRESLRARRELESIYESERAQTMKEREERKEKEEEMQASMQRMKETLAQREMRAGLDDGSGGSGGAGAGSRPSASRGSSFRSGPPTPNPQQGSESGSGGQFAPPGGLQRSDSRSSSKLVMQKDKIIEGLRLELAEAQIKLVEVENMGGGRMQDLQRQMYEVKMQNARLMEENESFQLLLTERTLHGEFSNSEFLRPPSNAGGSRPPSRQPNQGGASLADELNGEDVDASFMTTTTEGGAGAGTTTDDQAKRFQGEISSLKDQNKALTLYINNIISRLLQHEQFETILDKTPDLMSGGPNSNKASSQQARGGTTAAAANTDKDLPPPPPPKDEIKTTFDNLEGRRPQDSQPADEDDQKPLGFLQRAKSVMSGGGSSGAGNRSSRPRPVTQVPSASDQQKLQERIRAAEEEKVAAGGGVTENPDTAPRVPLGGGLGRAGSVRGGGAGHRRANSDWNAAGLVGNMFKGASSSSSGAGWGGPLSPGLTSPTGSGPGGRNSFFGGSGALTSQQSQAQQQPAAQTSRVSSGGTQQVPTISETDGGSSGKENAFPSTTTTNNNNNPTDHSESDPSSTSAAPGGGNSSSSTGPSSPPRSTTSSGERDRGGAVMMGSKPRPLRLVQEAKEDEAASKKANRGSWFGWMNKGTGSSGSGAGAGAGAGVGGRSVSGGGNGDV